MAGTRSLSPMECLPPELLSIILWFSFNPRETRLLIPARSPHILRHVCRYWRQVVDSTPRQWSDIYLNAKDINHPRFDQNIAIITDWVARSRGQDMTLHINDASSELKERDWETIMGILMLNSSRWKYVHLCLNSKALATLFQATSDWRGGSLITSMEVHFSPIDYLSLSSAVVLKTAVFSEIPQIPAVPSARYFSQSIHTLLELTVTTSGHVNHFLGFFQLFPALRTLVITFRHLLDNRRPISEHSDIICHPTLSTLDMKIDGPEIAALKRLSLPGLRVFNLAMVFSRSINVWKEVHGLMRRSCCPLESLTISTPPISQNTTWSIVQPDDIQYLQGCRTLTRWTGLPRISSVVLAMLTRSADSGEPAIAPCLEHFGFTGDRSTPIQNYVAMIVSRWGGAKGPTSLRRLRSVQIDRSPPKLVRDDLLIRCVQEGLVLRTTNNVSPSRRS